MTCARGLQDGDAGRKGRGSKQGRLCHGGLFGDKSSWIALCNGVRKDEGLAGDASSEEESPKPTLKKKRNPAEGRGGVPSWWV